MTKGGHENEGLATNTDSSDITGDTNGWVNRSDQGAKEMSMFAFAAGGFA